MAWGDTSDMCFSEVFVPPPGAKSVPTLQSFLEWYRMRENIESMASNQMNDSKNPPPYKEAQGLLHKEIINLARRTREAAAGTCNSYLVISTLEYMRNKEQLKLREPSMTLQKRSCAS